VDVFDEGDHLLIIAELPGVEEEDIEIGVGGDTLTLSAKAPGQEYFKEVALPCPVEGEAKTSYRNGILQIELTKEER
jgi:HSP20 family protein